jgi:polyketide cyclase/dehydrase/lipid transport protein
MLKKILIGIAVVIVLFVVVVAMQPAQYRVSRTATIPAAPAVVFEHVNDLHKWDAWSPWAKLDPAMKTTFEGPQSGPGASYAWVGNKQVGEGKMSITDSKANELVRLKLEFIKPFASMAVTEFTFKPEGEQTSVTWSMTGDKNFISKAVCLFMNMDKMVGGDFEKGLAGLKSVVQVAAK